MVGADSPHGTVSRPGWRALAARISAGILVALMLSAGAACTTAEPDAGAPGPGNPPDGTVPLPEAVELELVIDGFEQPLYVTGAGDGSGRLFVLEKTGRVSVVRGMERGEVFLDLSGAVSTESEQGLLGIAFSPSFAEESIVWVNYTRADGATVVSSFPASGDRADETDEYVWLTVPQPFANHNGGMIAFGPDGHLYVGLGDGGSGGDPDGNGQDPNTLLGSILRLNVRYDASEVRDTAYGIPEDNPFFSVRGKRSEIWAYGLRNPWRFSFDRETGDLWIGDVGQSAWEEIDFQPADSAGGENYGWNVLEGTHPYPPDASAPDDPDRFTPPLFEYDRDAGKSVTGGYVYRGSEIPWLQGTYVYGDFVDGRIWGLTRAADGTVENRLLLQTPYAISSFGEDDAGELYVVDFGGGIYRMVPAE
jgi:glucose/arabinose dehydrogenase